ncbi:hypothetical protein GCM10009839_86520 [Catenulispora yoronensis]|uniref:Uncharacterized protein n=1 Tax=Catenulispora yoronensis TaxID=450799 RepID=A0ABP5H3T4_9ACTN
MSEAYIRDHYGVPARVGVRVTVDGAPGVITGFDQASLLVHLDGDAHPVKAHPTWRVEYHPAVPAVQTCGGGR